MKIQKHFQLVVEAINLVDEEEIEKAITVLKEARKTGSRVWLIGNGGSASTCSHFANDLIKIGHVRAVDVTGMTPVTLAYGNDYGWDRMFANLLKEMVDPNDVVVAISCSGTSPNVVNAVKEVGWKTKVIILTGAEGGSLVNFPLTNSALGPQAIIKVPSSEIRVVEDIHMMVCHAIAGAMND